MTIIVAFVNKDFAILGIDGMVSQTRCYDDGATEKHKIHREKLGEIGDVFVAHQGRITSKTKDDYTTQDVCNKVNLERGLTFPDKCASIIKQFTNFVDLRENNYIVIAGIYRDKPCICIYKSEEKMARFGSKQILVTNQEDFQKLDEKGVVQLLEGDYDLVSFESAFEFVNGTLKAFIDNFENYGGEPKIETIRI